MTSNETVGRYTFHQQAADAAVLRTAETGDTHTVQHDVTTDTYLVIRETA